jgi:hypothetical protein
VHWTTIVAVTFGQSSRGFYLFHIFFKVDLGFLVISIIVLHEFLLEMWCPLRWRKLLNPHFFRNCVDNKVRRNLSNWNHKQRPVRIRRQCERAHGSRPDSRCRWWKQVVRGDHGGEAGDPVHPRSGRARCAGREVDEVQRRDQRCGHLQFRSTVSVRLVEGAGRHHGALHAGRGRHLVHRRCECEVLEREARADRRAVHHAQQKRVGPVYALHGALCQGESAGLREELRVLD